MEDYDDDNDNPEQNPKRLKQEQPPKNFEQIKQEWLIKDWKNAGSRMEFEYEMKFEYGKMFYGWNVDPISLKNFLIETSLPCECSSTRRLSNLFCDKCHSIKFEDEFFHLVIGTAFTQTGSVYEYEAFIGLFYLEYNFNEMLSEPIITIQEVIDNLPERSLKAKRLVDAIRKIKPKRNLIRNEEPAAFFVTPAAFSVINYSC